MGTDGRAKHVLVINDTVEILDLFKVLLEDEGYRVSLDNFSALDLGRKLADIRQLRPDAIILDFLIGGEQLGWQLLELVKLDPETATIPIVICTAAVRQVEELSGHLRTMGVEIVLKPFNLDQMLSALNRALHPAGDPRRPGTPSQTSDPETP